jgi:hypothetical protein
MTKILAFGLSAAALAACGGGGAPAQVDAGLDATADVAIDVQDETIDAAIEAQEEPAPVPCGIATVWTSDIPNDLACTGLYSDFQNKVVDSAALSYTPGLVLWSDGATKQRWIYLPPNSQIDDSNMDEWTFPVGTKVWKEFQVDGQRIETRMFTKAANETWMWTTYQWTSDGTAAIRNDNGATNVVATYEIPSHYDCNQCHAGRNDRLMGFEAIALSLSSAQGLTLDTLAKTGKLTNVPANTTATLPEDATGKAGVAFGVLHIDCGVSCHNQNGSANGDLSGLWMRLPAADVLAGTAIVSSLDAYTTSVNVAPTTSTYFTYASQGYKRILPGNSSMSLIVTVANERGPGQMPPIVTHVVDDAGVASLEAWIDAL